MPDMTGISVRPVCCPLIVQAVSPCRTRQIFGRSRLMPVTALTERLMSYTKPKLLIIDELSAPPSACR